VDHVLFITQSRHIVQAVETSSFSGKRIFFDIEFYYPLMILLQLTFSYLSVGMKSELVLSEEKRNQRLAKSTSLKKMKIENPGINHFHL
jgi:hypothetical protein